jgi:hypothetical protein
MLQITGIALFFSYLMVVWLKTNAFVEYMTLFKQDSFFHVAEYNTLHKEGYAGIYTDFLFEYYNDSFIVRLVSCPVCLSFWLGLFSVILTGSTTGILAAPLILFFYLLFHRML